MGEKSLKSYIKDFGNNCPAKVLKENVCLITFQVDGVAESLADSGLLHLESLTQYVEGYTNCSVAEFTMFFSTCPVSNFPGCNGWVFLGFNV